MATPVARDPRQRRFRIAVVAVSALVAVAGAVVLVRRDSGENATTRGVTATVGGLPGHPGSVAAGKDAVWFALVDTQLPVRQLPILRLDLASDALKRSVDVGGQARYLLHAGDTLFASVAHAGSNGSGPSRIVALDWRTGSLRLSRQYQGALGPLVKDGNVLWALQTRPGRLLRLDTTTLLQRSAPLELPAGQSLGLAVGAGSVWVAASDAGKVLRIDPATLEITESNVGGFPLGIAVAGGEVWITDRERGTLARLDAKTLRTIGDPIQVGPEPSALVGAGDYLFAGRAGRGTVTRIHVPTGRRVGRPIRFAQRDANASGFALAPSGASVWVSSFAASTLTRISSTGANPAVPAATVSKAQRASAAQSGLPRGAKIVAEIEIPSGSGSLAIGEGSVWSMSDLTARLARIDPRHNRIVKRIPIAGGGEIAVGDGSVWVTHPDTDTVTRMDPSTYEESAPIHVGGRPLGIAVTPRAVWVANANVPSLSRIDPATNTVVKTIRLGPQSMCCGLHMDVIAAGRAVWVVVSQGNRLIRVDPATNDTTVINVDYPPCAGLVADESTVWSAGGDCADVVARIDQRTKTVKKLFEPHPIGLAAAFGTIWVANLRSHNVDQLDRRTHHVVARLPVGGIPIHIRFGFGSLWMHDDEGRILRIDPVR
ncbi:MAG TPA: hypothetical protein VFD90_04225 [Gaiellales bacterium]|nr:hypothetical protein [Gaiellales bacterium]